MANMRVHELAKELNISSKAITDMLSNADKKYTAMSGLGESEINSVKSKFTKAAGNTANKSGPKKADQRRIRILRHRIRLVISQNRIHRILKQQTHLRM